MAFVSGSETGNEAAANMKVKSKTANTIAISKVVSRKQRLSVILTRRLLNDILGKVWFFRSQGNIVKISFSWGQHASMKGDSPWERVSPPGGVFDIYAMSGLISSFTKPFLGFVTSS